MPVDSEGSTSAARRLPKTASERAAARPGGRNSFVEPTLLCALAIRPAHGYELIRAVEELTDGLVSIDPPAVYRLLRRLEGEGLVASAWAEGVSGPQRRTYTLTPAGWSLLGDWRGFLTRQRQVCNLTMAAIESVIDVWAPEHAHADAGMSSMADEGVGPDEPKAG